MRKANLCNFTYFLYIKTKKQEKIYQTNKSFCVSLIIYERYINSIPVYTSEFVIIKEIKAARIMQIYDIEDTELRQLKAYFTDCKLSFFF